VKILDEFSQAEDAAIELWSRKPPASGRVEPQVVERIQSAIALTSLLSENRLSAATGVPVRYEDLLTLGKLLGLALAPGHFLTEATAPMSHTW
jgi:hypothetical protein